MLTDTELKQIAFHLLLEKLGELDTERFIKSLLKEPKDYTLWQQNYFENKANIQQISDEAMTLRNKRK